MYRGARPRPAPDHFAFDLRIQIERRRFVSGWEAKVDQVREVVGGKAELQTDRPRPYGALDRMPAGANRHSEVLRPSPENRFETALAGQRGDDATRSAVREQSKSSVEVGLARAVGTRDDVELLQGEPEVTQ